jgi:small subunit ribosomal protein S16
MAVKIRMMRTGAKNEPSFRCVAIDGRSPRDGRFLENLGWYDPKRTGINYQLKLDRIDYWVKQGAQVSVTVGGLVKKSRRQPS